MSIDPTISTFLGLLSNILIFIFLLTKRVNLSTDTHGTLIKLIFWLLLIVIIFGFGNQILHNQFLTSKGAQKKLMKEKQELLEEKQSLLIQIDSLQKRLDRPYQTIGQFSEDEELAVIRKGDNWGFVDKDGFEKFLDKNFQQVTKYNEGLSGVMLSNGKWGFINTRGIFPVGLEAKFDQVNRFDNGQAIVQQNNQRLVIDRKGRVLREIVNNTD